jgi:hypothetical protein
MRTLHQSLAFYFRCARRTLPLPIELIRASVNIVIEIPGRQNLMLPSCSPAHRRAVLYQGTIYTACTGIYPENQSGVGEYNTFGK